MTRNIILISGHRKCGTSLLHRLFDGHDHLDIYPVDFALGYAYCPFASKMNKSRRIERIFRVLTKSLGALSSEMLEELNLDIEGFVGDLVHRYKIYDRDGVINVLDTFALAWAEHVGSDIKKKFVIKETSHSVFFADFIQHNDSLKIIHLIRDPRDNFAALKSGVEKYYSLMGENIPQVFASFQSRALFDFSVAKDLVAMNGLARVVKYEDLTRFPNRVMHDLANFLGIEFRRILLEPSVAGVFGYVGNSHSGVQHNGVSKERIGIWKGSLDLEEIRLVEFFFQDAMKHWGYDLSGANCASFSELANFYAWFNSNYFYSDSFSDDVPMRSIR